MHYVMVRAAWPGILDEVDESQLSQEMCFLDHHWLVLMLRRDIVFSISLTNSEVEAGWHELISLLRLMQPSSAHANEQYCWKRGAAHRHKYYYCPQSITQGLYPVDHKLLLISRPTPTKVRGWVVLSTLLVMNLLSLLAKWPGVRFELETWKLRLRYFTSALMHYILQILL